MDGLNIFACEQGSAKQSYEEEDVSEGMLPLWKGKS
jgi:predicted peroxiredoxin